MFNCNCCEIWWMFFLWTLFVQLNIVANLLFACRFKMGYFCLFVQLNIVPNLLFACRFKMWYFCLFVQLNIVANLLFACRFKMGYFCFNLAIAPHTVQLMIVCDPLGKHTSIIAEPSVIHSRSQMICSATSVRRVSGTICDIALSHTRTRSKPCPM